MGSEIHIKDINREVAEALHTIKFVCETFKGSCKECPVGMYVKGEYGMTYKCALKNCNPRFLEIKPFKPFRLIKEQYKEE